MAIAPDPPPSLVTAALWGRCPRCGKGVVFSGLLTVRPACAVCGLDLSAHDAGDGPAVAVIFVLGALIMVLAFWVEFTFSPPLWVHVVLWPIPTVVLAVAVMRPMKALMVALQYRHRASEMGL